MFSYTCVAIGSNAFNGAEHIRSVASLRKRRALRHSRAAGRLTASTGLQTLDFRHAAVDEELLPVHEAGIVASKKQRRCDFLRFTHAFPRDQGFEVLLRFLVRTASCIVVAIAPGNSKFTRIFLFFSSFGQVRAKERTANLLAAYTLKPGSPFAGAFDPVMKIDPPSLNSGNAFWTVKSVPRTLRSKVLSKCWSVILPSGTGSPCRRSRTRCRSCPFLLYRLEKSVEVVEVGRVTSYAGHVPANQLDCLIERFLLPARDENEGTLFNKQFGARQPCRRSTRDDCNLSLKLSHNYSLR